MPTVVAASTMIDSGVVTELVSLTKTVMGLFSEFPLNFMLVGGLCGIAFGIFRNAKHAAM